MQKTQFFVSILVLILFASTPVFGQVEITLESSSNSVSVGENFTISVRVDPDVPVTGIEMDMSFDPSFAEALSVEEGDFLQTSGSPTIFNSGDIDGESGTISNIFGVILGKSNTSSEGHFAHITFKTGNSSGTYEFEVQNIVVSNETGESLPYVSRSVYASSSSSGISSTSSNSADGGGGGGGGSDGEPPANVALKQVASQNLAAKNPASYGFDDPLNPVAYINFTPLTNAGQTKATVELLNNTSVFVDSPAGENVYANFNLWVGLAGYATHSNINDSEIIFKMPVEWFGDTGVSVLDIVLKRYNEGSWASLPTDFLFEKDGYTYFKSQTPGFSPFAIVYVKSGQNSGDTSFIDDPISPNTESEDTSAKAQDPFLPELSQNSSFILLIVLLMLSVYRYRH